MDEEMMILESEEDDDVENLIPIEDQPPIEDIEQVTIQEEAEEIVEVEAAEDVEIVIEEAVGWVGGDSTKHYSLAGRDEPNQHPITSIVGLRDELDDIEALKTVYSDKVGIANYYEWNDGVYDEHGYFVSLVPHTSKIKVCDGADIFGVTVDVAGFVGGQNEDVPRDNRYGLVVTSGLVDVRCESDVAEGDYVVSNARGVATKTTCVISNNPSEKTTLNCGYQVIAKENKHGVDYVTIALGVQACTTDALGQNLQRISTRMTDAEINIAAAMNVANDAYNKASESATISSEALQEALEALGKTDEVMDAVNNANSNSATANQVAAQARAIAESAVTSAEQIRQEAYNTANDALDNVHTLIKQFEPIESWVDPTTGQVGAEYIIKYMDEQGLSTKAELQVVESFTEENKSLIEQNAQNITTMVSSVDKYSVGEYSQAYGLTLEQAQNILKLGMIYIPTQHGDTDTHYEDYEGSPRRDFTNGYYYEWTTLDDGTITWSEKLGRVWFGTEQPAGTIYTYWYDGDKLYILNDGKWVEVATLAGNVNNRITSMIRQDVDSITAEVVNARGGVASLGVRITDTESKVNSIASWPSDVGDDKHNMAILKQHSDGDSSHLALATIRNVKGSVDELEIDELSGATIVLSDDEDGSFIQLDANNINFKAQDVDFSVANSVNFGTHKFNVYADDILFEGEDGSKMTFSANNIDFNAEGFTLDAGCIDFNVDTFTIGGRNYLVDSEKEQYSKVSPGETFGPEFLRTTFDLAPFFDEYGLIEITLSFDAYSPVPGRVKIYGQNGSYSRYRFDEHINVTTEWKRYSVTFTPTGPYETEPNGTPIKNAYLAFFGNGYGSGIVPHVRKVKLEKGKFATDWTPATLDVDAYVTFTNLAEKNDKTVINGGNIEAGTITADQLNTDAITSKGYVPNSVGSKLNLQDGSFDSPHFKVSSSNGVISTRGTIAGWTITEDMLTTYNNTTKTCVGLANDTNMPLKPSLITSGNSPICLFAGAPSTGENATPNIAKSEFAVLSDGSLYASSIRAESTIGSVDMNGRGGLMIYSSDGDLGQEIYMWNDTLSVHNKTKNMGWSMERAHNEPITKNDSSVVVDVYRLATSNCGLVLNGSIWGYLKGEWYVEREGSAPVVTSDRTQKYEICDQPEVYSHIFDRLNPVIYKYNNGLSDRIHTGFIAQDVEEAVLAEGLTTKDFSAVCYDIDDEGNKTNYGVRYGEIVSMNTYEIQKLKARVTQLENKIALLTKQEEKGE